MTLTGDAFLCIWNDIDPAVGDEYESWHTLEHVPERVASPGFRSGRRYGAFDRPEDRYLTVYDIDGLAALDTPEYVDLQQNPTPWSARMRPYFRNVLRIPFERVAGAGEGCAGHVAVLALDVDDTDGGVSRRIGGALAARYDEQRIAAFQVGRAESVPEYGVFGLRADRNASRHKVIAIVEVTTPADANQTLRWCRTTMMELAPGATVLRAETSELIYSVGHEEVVAKWRRAAGVHTRSHSLQPLRGG